MTAATGVGTVDRIPKQFLWNGVRVPYIAPWSGERPLARPVTTRRARTGMVLGYTDEVEAVDRKLDVLWTRVPLGRGRGEPKLDGVHPLRQRRCMVFLLCQVCGGPTLGKRRDERTLFVMRAADGEQIAEGEVTAVPPVHEACAGEAVRDCPKLGKGYRAALVEYTPAWGVAGVAYDRRTLKALAPPDGHDLAYAPYGDDRLAGWVVATREVVSLHGVTPVDLADLGRAR